MGLKTSSSSVRDEMWVHDSTLRAFLTRRLRHAQDVDDYVQDVYTRALSSEPARPISNLRGFLLRVARCVLVDNHRRNVARLRSQHVSWDEAGHSGADERSPERLFLAREKLQVLESTLVEISPLGRECFQLVRVEGLRPAEAATRLGITEKAVTRQLERVLVRLTTALGRHRELDSPPSGR